MKFATMHWQDIKPTRVLILHDDSPKEGVTFHVS
jgi:hypothetical protein